MLWIFAILGSVTLMTILIGMATALPRRKWQRVLRVVALILLGIAWALKHTTVWGWLCLAMALAIEIITRRMDRIEADGKNESHLTGPPTTETSHSQEANETCSDSGEDLHEGEMPSTTFSQVEETSEEQPETSKSVTSDDINEAQLPIVSQPDNIEGTTHPPVIPETPDASEASEPSETLSESADIEITEPQSAAPADEIAPEPEVRRNLSTHVLFRSSTNLSPDVFLASLRRSGQRDAALVDPSDSDGKAWFSAGSISLSLTSVPKPCDPEQIAIALSQTTDWPEGSDIVADHEIHSILTSTYRPDTPLDQVVRLHHRAHAALSEFTPVVAVLWPEAGRLVSADQLPEFLAVTSDLDHPMAETCTLIRDFPLEGENAGLMLTDSVGLHAFGLPDIQIISNGKPDGGVIEEMRRLVERFFTTGCDLEDGSVFFMEGCDTYRVTCARSAFAPDREIIQLTQR